MSSPRQRPASGAKKQSIPRTTETDPPPTRPTETNPALDDVDEASEESFPASDAPSHTPVTGTHPEDKDE